MANEWQPTLDAWLAALNEKGGQDYALSVLPQVILVGLENGLSGQAMARSMAAAGSPITDYRLYKTIAEVRGSLEQEAVIGGFSMTGVPDTSEFETWTTTNASGFVYRFEATFNQMDEDGNILYTVYRPFSVNSRTPISISDAMADANDALSTSNLDKYLLSYVGLTVAHLYQMQPGS